MACNLTSNAENDLFQSSVCPVLRKVSMRAEKRKMYL